MIIVGFTYKTSKILPRILCHRFRHCAPITVGPNGKMKMYQFVRRGQIAELAVSMRDLRVLRSHGWVFVCIPNVSANNFTPSMYSCTCVAMTRHAIGMRGVRPVTPYGLYKKITANRRDFL